MAELVPRPPDHVVNMIDNEGWPDALEWLVKNDFGDADLNQLIFDANEVRLLMNDFENRVQARCEALGVDWYLA